MRDLLIFIISCGVLFAGITTAGMVADHYRQAHAAEYDVFE
jgi:hypothetical protein